jgi:hypothetical protein
MIARIQQSDEAAAPTSRSIVHKYNKAAGKDFGCQCLKFAPGERYSFIETSYPHIIRPI